ncbi:MAG: TolC family protein [Sediminibacterium sp.]|nr:TolC family protein [Sediminibacterium sp.]MBX9781348.1 TolC family protein [Chitinophagaceae bacterium]
MRKTFLYFIGALLTLQATSQQVLTLPNAVAIALKNSYDIQLAKDNLDIAAINNNIGIAGGLPTVNATASDNETVTSINQKFPDPSRDLKRSGVSSNTLTGAVTGGILLFNGFRVKAAKKRLEELELLNKNLLNAQIQNTMAGVANQYYDIVRQQYFLQTIHKSMEVASERLRILKSRKEAGLANNADIFQADLDYNVLVQQAEAQQLVINQGKVNLLNLIFVRPDSAIVVKDTIIIDNQINFQEIRNAALQNPQISASEQQIKINQLLEREIAALRAPTLRGTTGFNYSNTTSAAGFILQNQSSGPFVGLNLAIPLYNGSINKRQQKIAEINTRIAKTQRDAFLLSVETGALKTYQVYTSTKAQIQTAQQNYELSKKLLDLVVERFALGASTIIDLKVAQQSYENEAYRLINLSYAAKIAEIELKRLSNTLAL